jgi:hypothetical protein
VSTRHPEAAEIAALGEELLTAAEAREIQEHLAGCPDCTAVAADLELLRNELAGLAPIEPMPEEVAARIDAALAAERSAAQGADETEAVTGPVEVSRETADHRRHAQRGRRPQFALAAAGAFVALGIGGLLAQQFSGTPQHDDTYAGSDMAEEHRADGDALEREVRGLLLSAEDAPSEFSTAEAGGDRDGHDPDESADPQGDMEMDDGGDRLVTFVPSCVSSVIGRPEAPLAASEDYLHNGVSSYVVVLPHTADHALVDAYVVAASCADKGEEPEPEDLLTVQSFPR